VDEKNHSEKPVKMYGIDNYPKNYHASGIGLVNLAALGYSKNEVSGGNEGGGAPKPKAGLYPSLPYPSSESVGGMPYVVKQTSHAQNASYAGPTMGMGMPVPGAHLDEQFAVVHIGIGVLSGGQMMLGVDLQSAALGLLVADVLEGIEVREIRLADIVQNDAVDSQLLGIQAYQAQILAVRHNGQLDHALKGGGMLCFVHI